MPAKYVRAYAKGQKNDFRDADGDHFRGTYVPVEEPSTASTAD